MVRALPAALCLALGACYDTPQTACAFACAQDGDCPDGYSCRPDAWCKRDGVADDTECPGTSPDLGPVDSGDGGGAAADASSSDASPADAAVDASSADAPGAAGMSRTPI